MTSPPQEPAPESATPDVPAVPWRWTDALLVLVLVFLSGIVVLPVLTALRLGVFFTPTLTVVGAILMGSLSILVVRARHPQHWRLLFGSRAPRWADVGVGVGAALVGLVGVTLIVVLLTLGGQPPQVQAELRDAMDNRSTLPLIALATILVVPIAEELLYRGVLFQALRTRLGRWPAMGLSGFIFGLLHVQWDSVAGTLLLLAAFYPFGMWLAWLLERRRTLLVPIVCHATYNGLNLLLFLNGK